MLKERFLFLASLLLSTTMAMESTDTRSTDVQEACRKASPHVSEIIRQYQAEKPNMPSFLNAVSEFSRIWHITPVHGVVRVFMKLNQDSFKEEYKALSADPLSYQRLKRTSWFVDHVVNELSKTNDNLSAMDYLYIAILNEQNFGITAREEQKQDNRNLENEMQVYRDLAYHYYKKALRADTVYLLDETALINCYGIALQAYERKKYAKAADYFEKRKQFLATLEQTEKGKILVEKAYGFQKSLGTVNPWVRNKIVPDLNLATCYFYCDRFEESLNLFEVIFKDITKLNDNFDAKNGIVTEEHLICLFTFWFTSNEPAIKTRLSSCIEAAKSLISTELSKMLAMNNVDDKGSAKSSSRKATTGKAKNKDRKVKEKARKGSIHPIFIEAKTKEIQKLFKSICDTHKLEKYEAEKKKHNLDESCCEEIARLLEELRHLRARIDHKEFQGFEMSKKTSAINEIYQSMCTLQDRLKQATSVLKNLVRKKVRESVSQCKLDASSNPKINLRAEVLKEQAGKVDKIKTTGVAAGVATVPATKIPVEPSVVKREEPCNHIVSWRANNPAQSIFINQDPQGFPEHTVELLNILSQSRNIHELGENLWAFDANLKKVKSLKNVWAFRINQKLRVRFTLTKPGFEDVRMGDFH